MSEPTPIPSIRCAQCDTYFVDEIASEGHLHHGRCLSTSTLHAVGWRMTPRGAKKYSHASWYPRPSRTPRAFE